MPAAAVIPAPIAYIKVVAVKKLVVGLLRVAAGRARNGRELGVLPASLGRLCVALSCRAWDSHHLL